MGRLKSIRSSVVDGGGVRLPALTSVEVYGTDEVNSWHVTHSVGVHKSLGVMPGKAKGVGKRDMKGCRLMTLGRRTACGGARVCPEKIESAQRFCSTFITPSKYQSTSIPFLFSSSLAISISPINSLCACGTLLNVKTPHPSLKRR